MLSLVHLDTGEDLRGGQIQLLMLARGLAARGHQQLIVTLDGTALEARARQEGYRVFGLPRHDPAGAHGVFQLRQLLHSEPFQILHAHDGRGQTISWLASMGMHVSRVASRRVIYAPPRRIDTRLKYGRTCDAVIAVSNYVRQLLVDAGVPDSRIEVIYDGVEIQENLPDAVTRSRLRAQWQWGCSDQDFVVGHIASAGQEKGLDVARDAASLLKESVPEARIVTALTGSGCSGPQSFFYPIEGEVLGMDGGGGLKVNYTSNLRTMVLPQNRSEFFTALDLFIMPSRAEGLGSAALLAMAHGVPVVASQVGGLPEIVEEGETGWLVPPGSAQALADAIVRAASDPVRLREMGIKARQRAAQFSSTLMVERTEKLYERLVGEKSLEFESQKVKGKS
ncbi:MAG TPA: glycosyltransferase family 4 protein [Terriglobia bacterium]|nr:glycosyltransferase family 4 protein [Terriglobia bacterium]